MAKWWFRKTYNSKKSLEKYDFYLNFCRYTRNRTVRNANEFVSFLNDFYPKHMKCSKLKIELSEKHSITPLEEQRDFRTNFIYINLSLNNCFVSVILHNVITNPEVEDHKKFEILSLFNNFIMYIMPNIDLNESKHLNHKNFEKCTYQKFVDYLISEFNDYTTNVANNFTRNLVDYSKNSTNNHYNDIADHFKSGINCRNNIFGDVFDSFLSNQVFFQLYVITHSLNQLEIKIKYLLVENIF